VQKNKIRKHFILSIKNQEIILLVQGIIHLTKANKVNVLKKLKICHQNKKAKTNKKNSFIV
jgi:hypothetical protein